MAAADSQIRDFLRRCDEALTDLAGFLNRFVAQLGVESTAPYPAFIAVLDRDARDAQAAVRLVLAQPVISSQLVDNLNASIHLRALLTDLFLIDEVLKTYQKDGIGTKRLRPSCRCQLPISLSALRSGASVFGAELRPPRAELATGEGMDAWIDTYHAVRRLTRQGTFVFLTDSAVGAQEEDNLRHLVTNLGKDVPRERIVPFLTAKHSLEYCLSYAERAHQSGFPALVVLGGDKSVGCAALGRARVAAAADAARSRSHDHARRMGQSARAMPKRRSTTWRRRAFTRSSISRRSSVITTSEHVERFLDAARRRGLTLPGVFGVFFYRSANPTTLAALQRLPAGAGRRADARVRGGRERRGRLRAHDARRCWTSAPATSTSATCPSAARRRFSRPSSSEPESSPREPRPRPMNTEAMQV